MKALIKLHNYTVKEVAALMGWESEQSAYYYFGQEKIKRTTVKDILGKLKIPITEFYPEDDNTDNSTGEAGTLYISRHQGKNLETAIRERDINIRKLAVKLNISHTTLYQYFLQKELDPGFLLLASKEIGVPVAQLKGVGNGEKSFEKDIYTMLHALSEQMKTMNGNVNRIMQHMGLNN